MRQWLHLFPFFGVVPTTKTGQGQHLEVGIRSSPSYYCSSGASSVDEGHVELCASWIFWDPISFHVRQCDFRSSSSAPRVSSPAIVAALVHYSFGALA
jgi:hypothetical protein